VASESPVSESVAHRTAVRSLAVPSEHDEPERVQLRLAAAADSRRCRDNGCAHPRSRRCG